MPQDLPSLSRQAALRRLRDHPALARILPALPPRSLVRLYDTVGVHDAGALMALTPPELLARALDEAVWTTHHGRTRLDPDVFVDWLEVWLDEGEEFAAEQLAAVDPDLLRSCFASLLAVHDSEVDGFHRWACDDGEDLDRGGRPVLPDCSMVVERFVVSPARDDEWDVVQAAVTALSAHAPDLLQRLLQTLTADDSRLDGEEAAPRFEQDAVGDRELRRERAGFDPPAAARAFLAQAGIRTASELAAMTDYDPESGRHLRQLVAAGTAEAATPAGPDGDGATDLVHSGAEPLPTDSAGELWSLLMTAGVVSRAGAGALAVGGLLTSPSTEPGNGRPLALQSRLDALAASDPAGFGRAASELAYLANVLMAAELDPMESAGEEARSLAFATANLGLELLEARGGAASLGRPPGLIQPFLLGWRALEGLPLRLVAAFERALAAPAARRFLSSRGWLERQAAESLRDLRAAVESQRLEEARDSVGLLSLVLHTDGCRAAVHLLRRPPRFPGLLEGSGKDAARWVGSLDDLQRLAGLLDSLAAKGLISRGRRGAASSG